MTMDEIVIGQEVVIVRPDPDYWSSCLVAGYKGTVLSKNVERGQITIDYSALKIPGIADIPYVEPDRCEAAPT